jgi:hypothetical protein
MIERLKPEPDLEQEEREERKRTLNHLEFDPGEVRKLERPAEVRRFIGTRSRSACRSCVRNRLAHTVPLTS